MHIIELFLNDFLEKQEVSEYCTAFMIDVDYFKEYNDTYGHYNGDIALKNITIIIKKISKKRHVYDKVWWRRISDIICM